MRTKLSRLKVVLFLLSLQTMLLGLKVWARESAYHAITRYSYRTGLVLRAGDDDDIEARIAAAVEEAVGPLKAKNKELLGKIKKLQADGDADPAEVERLEAEVDRLKTDLTAANKSVKDLTKRAETAEQSLASEQAAAQRLIVDNGLAAALTEAGVTNPAMHKAAAALIRTGQKIEITADGDARVAKIGDKTLGDFVKAWAAGDEGKTFVAAPGNGGGGAPGSGSHGGGKANPWAKDTFSLTEQGKLFTENPTLARSMAQEAGVTLP